jgi:hypothetical protein
MNRETRDRRLLELLHDVAQKGETIKISDDFPGMLTVTIGKRSHQHLGCPHGNLKDLDTALRNYLAECLSEDTEKET